MEEKNKTLRFKVSKAIPKSGMAFFIVKQEKEVNKRLIFGLKTMKQLLEIPFQ